MEIIAISKNQWIFQGNEGMVPQVEARCCDCWRKLFSSCLLKGFKPILEHRMASGEYQASSTKIHTLWYFTALY